MNEKVTNVWYEVDYYDLGYGWTRSMLAYTSPEEAKKAWPLTYADGDLKIFQVVTTESEVTDA